jgi:hypothetical protein
VKLDRIAAFNAHWLRKLIKELSLVNLQASPDIEPTRDENLSTVESEDIFDDSKLSVATSPTRFTEGADESQRELEIRDICESEIAVKSKIRFFDFADLDLPVADLSSNDAVLSTDIREYARIATMFRTRWEKSIADDG